MPDVIQVVRAAPVGPTAIQVKRSPTVQVIRPGAAVPVVRVSRQGPPGISGASAGRMLYRQSSASSSWPITHSLGAYPQVQVLDESLAAMDPDIVHSSTTQIAVIFAQPTTGYAILS